MRSVYLLAVLEHASSLTPIDRKVARKIKETNKNKNTWKS